MANWSTRYSNGSRHSGLGEEASSIRCPECGEHWEEIIAGDGPGGSAQFFIRCPEVLRIEVTQQHRRQWRPNLSALVHLLASSLDLAGKPQELMTGRLWRLGANDVEW